MTACDADFIVVLLANLARAKFSHFLLYISSLLCHIVQHFVCLRHCSIHCSIKLVGKLVLLLWELLHFMYLLTHFEM